MRLAARSLAALALLAPLLAAAQQAPSAPGPTPEPAPGWTTTLPPQPNIPPPTHYPPAQPAPARPATRPPPPAYTPPPPPPYARPVYRYAPPPPGYAYRAPAVVYAPPPPYWSGYRAGYGYYPIYPAAPPPPPPGAVYAPAYAAPQPPRSAVEFSGTATFLHDTAGWGLFTAFDGPVVGFDAGYDSLPVLQGNQANQPMYGYSDSVGLGSAHLTFSIVNAPGARVRLEAGGSSLWLPNVGAFAGTRYAGSVAFGPDLGVSGRIGLIGPLGFEGHARWTPTPISVFDGEAAAAVHGGPLSLKVGYRWVELYGDGVAAPRFGFEGPEVGLGLHF